MAGLVPLAILAVVFVAALMGTRVGLAMRGVHDDEVVAGLLGVSVRATQVFAFSVGGALVGLSGGLYAHQFGFVDAPAFDVIRSVDILLCVLLGGTQTPWGPLVGTVVFTLLPEVLRNLIPGGSRGAGRRIERNGNSHRQAGRRLALRHPGHPARVGMMALRPQGLITSTMVARLGPGHRGRGGGMIAPLLAVEDVHLAFGGVQVLRGVSFTVAADARLALIGPNGAGKTTLFNLVSGVHRPDAGRVLLDGADISAMPPAAAHRAWDCP